MKAFFEFLAMFGINHVVDLVSEVLKGYCTRLHLAMVERVRLLALIFVLTMACLFLLLSGVILLHVAFFLYLSWSIEDKLKLMAGLGAFYIAVAIAFICFLQSRSRWFTITGAKNVLKDHPNKKD